jgi:hypothetical protein
MTSTLVPCRFLHVAHPGYLRRDEAEEELKSSLHLTDNATPFQLSSCTISVLISEGKPEWYSFQAIVVEMTIPRAAPLKERFFSLGDPTQAKTTRPYVGSFQFVPNWSLKNGSSTKSTC